MRFPESLPESNSLDNVIVRQKNGIISLIDTGKFAEARAALSIISELWRAVTPSYTYKERELYKRLIDAEECAESEALERAERKRANREALRRARLERQQAPIPESDTLELDLS